MTQTPGERLWQAVRARKLRGPAALARLAKLNPVTVASYMRDERSPSLEACFSMAKVLDVDAFWLHRGKGEAPVGDVLLPEIAQIGRVSFEGMKESAVIEPVDVPVTRESKLLIPLYSAAFAGPDGSVTINAEFVDMIEAPHPLSNVAKAYAVRVAGESMEPRYEPGEIVYCHPRQSIKKGDYVVAQISGGADGEIQGFVKRFVSIDDQSLVLEQINPAKKMKFPRSRVKSVHKVVLAGI